MNKLKLKLLATMLCCLCGSYGAGYAPLTTGPDLEMGASPNLALAASPETFFVQYLRVMQREDLNALILTYLDGLNGRVVAPAGGEVPFADDRDWFLWKHLGNADLVNFVTDQMLAVTDADGNPVTVSMVQSRLTEEQVQLRFTLNNGQQVKLVFIPGLVEPIRLQPSGTAQSVNEELHAAAARCHQDLLAAAARCDQGLRTAAARCDQELRTAPQRLYQGLPTFHAVGLRVHASIVGGLIPSAVLAKIIQVLFDVPQTETIDAVSTVSCGVLAVFIGCKLVDSGAYKYLCITCCGEPGRLFIHDR